MSGLEDDTLERRVQRMESFLGSELGYANNTRGNIGRQVDDLWKRTNSHTEAIYGTNNSAGLLARTDTLEEYKQDHKRVTQWLIKLAIGQAATFAATVIGGIVIGVAVWILTR